MDARQRAMGHILRDMPEATAGRPVLDRLVVGWPHGDWVKQRRPLPRARPATLPEEWPDFEPILRLLNL